MSVIDGVDYGPLALLVGEWSGDEGVDLAPEPDGDETNPYYETLSIEAGGSLSNAEEQNLAMLRYHQVVKRKSNDEVFHDEVGYWIWDAAAKTVMLSMTIPRAVCVLAGGTGTEDPDGRMMIDVNAKLDDDKWKIIESPFMAEKASTLGFHRRVYVDHDTLTYRQTSMLQIYGQPFEHTDENTLKRV